MAEGEERVQISVPAEAAGTRLDRFLAGIDVVGSRSAAEHMLQGDAVLVDGLPRPKSHRLSGGETIQVFIEPKRAHLEAEEVDFRLAYEDDHLLVVFPLAYPSKDDPSPDPLTETLEFSVSSLTMAWERGENRVTFEFGGS